MYRDIYIDGQCQGEHRWIEGGIPMSQTHNDKNLLRQGPKDSIHLSTRHSRTDDIHAHERWIYFGVKAAEALRLPISQFVGDSRYAPASSSLSTHSRMHEEKSL